MFNYECKICQTVLAPDELCSFCNSQEQVEIAIQKYEKYFLGWITEEQQYDLDEFGWPSEDQGNFQVEQTAYLAEFDKNNNQRFEGTLYSNHEASFECSCSVCKGQPQLDPILKLIEEYGWQYNNDLNYRPRNPTPQYKLQNMSPFVKINSRNYLAFDIEIAKTIPDGLDSWDSYRPFGITCAATIASDGSSKIWYGKTVDGGFADKMSRNEVIQLVKYMEGEVESGKTLLTWNGAGFDFNVLAEESALNVICAKLAYNHVDMMFHFFCKKGFALGMEKAAKGMGLAGKMESVGGKNAANFWQEGRCKEVLDYVHQDVVTTLEIW